MTKVAELKEEITVPENVQIEKEDDKITVKSDKGELSRVFTHPKINLKVDKEKVEITSKNVKKKEKALLITWATHIRNMIKGLTEGFEYKMKTVYSHFPIKTTVEDDYLIIKNFLGEKSPRRAKILPGVTVESKEDDLTIKGIDREKIGQTAANIERATRVKKRDIRVYQDGIYLVSKGNRGS
ncbi:MAG: 50S ribosomal protein L6 [Candidatus Thermoplasmatota archaeon]